jgi:hypothetical protein
MPDQAESGLGAKSWIPQLFYDIIARIVPGAVIIGALALAAAGPEKSGDFVELWLNKPSNSYPSIAVIIIFGFVLSYALAIVLLGLCYLILPLTQRSQMMKSAESNNDFSTKYDFIKRNDPVAGSRITKLMAEIHMAGILIFGLSLSLVINFWKMFTAFTSSRVLFMIVLFLAIAGSAGAFRYFVDRQDHAVNNCADLLGYEEWKRNCQRSNIRNVPNDSLNADDARS